MNSRTAQVRVSNHLMLSKSLLSLALGIAVVIAPAAPIEIAKIVSPKKSCSSYLQVNADPCQGCPMTPSSSNSTSGSSCCSAQAPCFVCYSHFTDGFVAAMDTLRFAQFANERVKTRSRRPPVPPPRTVIS